VFDISEPASLLSFIWTEKTAAMSEDDYKQALRLYANLAVKHRVRRGLIDLRKFRFPVAEALMSWRAREIVPLYHQAGLEKFAYVLPDTAAQPEERPARAEPGEQFLTKRFRSEIAAMAWLTAAA
jgi:hypothetical protein